MAIRLTALFAVILIICAPGPAFGQDEETDAKEPRRCINTGSVLRTRVIDDQNVVFMMRRDEMYLNTLRSRCHGLSRTGSFSYRIQTRSLCELETITVIERGTIGQPLGRTCSLGMFKPVTMEELTQQFAPVIRERQLKRVEPPPIEEIGEQEVPNPPQEED